MLNAELQLRVELAAELIKKADGLLIGVGAGMGVDSGMPDFRGENGFWKAYPGLAKAGLEFTRIACPDQFLRNPRRAWGFYGHRLNLYRNLSPHSGHDVLLQIARSMPKGYAVITSNVDGHMAKAGFDASRIYEVHGSIHTLQCLQACTNDTWPADHFHPVVDEEKCQLLSDIPQCPHCGGFARPNILMFGDWSWNSRPSNKYSLDIERWITATNNKVIIEIGAGDDIPTVRMLCDEPDTPKIRINPRLPHVDNGIGIAAGAKETLYALAHVLNLKEAIAS